jgi:hypothetical protein
MGPIAESNMLLHPQVKLPAGVRMATEQFHEGWLRIRTGGKQRLEKTVRAKGWHFVQIADGVLRSGVGDTEPAAIANALQLELRRLGEHSHAVEVERIELTKYPWFFLARVRVSPYRIQRQAGVPNCCQELAAPRRRGGMYRTAAPQPLFGCAAPDVRDLLLVPLNAEAGAE